MRLLPLESRPNAYLIEVEDSRLAGEISLTEQRELLVVVYEEWKGNGIAQDAIRLLMNQEPHLYTTTLWSKAWTQ